MIGIGLNVSLRADELPVPTAGSLALAGAVTTDRDPLLRAVLRSLAQLVRGVARGGRRPGRLAASRRPTRPGCATLGRTVRAELPGGRSLTGEAVAVDGDGRLDPGHRAGDAAAGRRGGHRAPAPGLTAGGRRAAAGQ